MGERTKLESAIDKLLARKTTKEIVGLKGLFKQLTKTLVKRAMNAELSQHLGYEKHASEGHGSGNNRSGVHDKHRGIVEHEPVESDQDARFFSG